jgi:RNA polymerase sigma-70 factor, ECF subfamily
MIDGSRGPSQTWEELLEAVSATQDRGAFGLLFRHFAPRIKSFLMRGGTSEALAEDVTQETMATIWRKAEQFDPGKASASTWIFTIARNKRIDRIRRERRPEPDPNDPSFAPSPTVPPDREVSALQDAVAVRHALGELSDEQREVVMLSFYEDASHSVIADRLKLPLGTVKSRLRLALKKLDGLLDPAVYGGMS